MTAVPFDTLKLARALREKAHFSQEQAEGMADAIAEAVQADIATQAYVQSSETSLRSDIAALQTNLREDIGGLRRDLRATDAALRSELAVLQAGLETRIAETKTDILKWMFGTIGFQTVLILGAVVALAKAMHT